MSNNHWKTFKALIMGVFMATSFVGMAIIAPTFAQDGGNQTLSVPVAKVLGEAYEFSQLEPPQMRSAVSAIDGLFASRADRMSAYEKATSYEMRGSFKASYEPPDYPGALRDFESAVAQNALTDERQRGLRFAIAQLYYTQERYPEAARFLQEYITYANSTGKNVDANTYFLLAASYVAMNDFRNARRPMEQALQKYKASGKPPKEGYYGLLNYIYSEVGAQSERGDLLVEMVNLWPDNAQYWAQLSGSYSAAGREDDAAATLELAYKAGIVSGEDKILSLVSYYSYLDNPYRGAVLLEKEMAAGNVQRNRKNLLLLAQMYTQAREQKKALGPLRAAAAIAPDGNIYYNLGLVLFGDEQWAESEKSFQSALSRGGLNSKKTGNAWLLIGNARYFANTDSPRAQRRAIEALRRAQNYPTARKAASDWITYIRDLQRAVRVQCDKELLQAQQRFKEDRKRCTTILEVVKRIGATSGFSESDITICRALADAKIDSNNGSVTYADGTVENGPSCKRGVAAEEAEEEASPAIPVEDSEPPVEATVPAE